MVKKKKGLFTAKRWHDDPSIGATIIPGHPQTEEEKKEADEEFKEIMIHYGLLKEGEGIDSFKNVE